MKATAVVCRGIYLAFQKHSTNKQGEGEVVKQGGEKGTNAAFNLQPA